MRMKSAFLLGFFLFVSGPPTATRSPAPPVFHGIHVQVSSRDGVHVARASYEGGGPVVSGDVTITAPGSDKAWQTGRTDPSGQFAFFPDAAGTWIIEVDDGRGHRARATVDVGAGEVVAGPAGEGGTLGDERATHTHEHGAEATEGHGPVRESELPSGESDEAPVAPTPSRSQTSQGEPRLWQLLTGLGLIAGLTGAAYGYTARRKGLDAG